MAGFSIGGYTSLALAGAKIDWDNVIRFTHTPEGFKEVNVPEMPGLIKMFEQDTIVKEFKKSPDLLDKRFKAVFVMSPAAGQGFSSKKQMKRIKVPVFIVGTESDSIAPIKTNGLHYKKLLPKSKWYLLKGKVGHYVFLNEGTAEMKSVAPAFFQDADGVNRNEIHQQTISLAEIFFNKIK
jgi:predicted dienelactone hydrolase